jgi:hypothetical protein
MGETALGIGTDRVRGGRRAGADRRPPRLEKLVLTKWQTFWKDQLGRFYGDRLHEGHYFDPALRDIEALLTSSQQRVTGDKRVRLAAGRFLVVGTRACLAGGPVATYGEENRLWSGDGPRQPGSPPFQSCSPRQPAANADGEDHGPAQPDFQHPQCHLTAR